MLCDNCMCDISEETYFSFTTCLNKDGVTVVQALEDVFDVTVNLTNILGHNGGTIPHLCQECADLLIRCQESRCSFLRRSSEETLVNRIISDKFALDSGDVGLKIIPEIKQEVVDDELTRSIDDYGAISDSHFTFSDGEVDIDIKPELSPLTGDASVTSKKTNLKNVRKKSVTKRPNTKEKLKDPVKGKLGKPDVQIQVSIDSNGATVSSLRQRFKCSTCAKTFSTKPKLTDHLTWCRRDDEESPFNSSNSERSEHSDSDSYLDEVSSSSDEDLSDEAPEEECGRERKSSKTSSKINIRRNPKDVKLQPEASQQASEMFFKMSSNEVYRCPVVDCPEANSPFEFLVFLLVHMEKDHWRPKYASKKVWRCNLCGDVFSNSMRLIVHICEEHTKEVPYKCSLCDFRSVYVTTLVRHNQIVHKIVKPQVIRKHKELKFKVQCVGCSQPFTSEQRLNVHYASKRISCTSNGKVEKIKVDKVKKCRKLQFLSLEKKQVIARDYEKYPNLKMICKLHPDVIITQTVMKRILQHVKKGGTAMDKNKSLDSYVLQKCQEAQKNGTKIVGTDIKRWAEEKLKTLPPRFVNDDGTVSTHWISKFRKLNGLEGKQSMKKPVDESAEPKKPRFKSHRCYFHAYYDEINDAVYAQYSEWKQKGQNVTRKLLRKWVMEIKNRLYPHINLSGGQKWFVNFKRRYNVCLSEECRQRYRNRISKSGEIRNDQPTTAAVTVSADSTVASASMTRITQPTMAPSTSIPMSHGHVPSVPCTSSHIANNVLELVSAESVPTPSNSFHQQHLSTYYQL